MIEPKVSIVVPCYNQAQYLSEALDSVLYQTHQNWECIIVNDGSLDNTNEVSNAYVLKDKRFKYIEIENKGLSNARNVGIKSSKGDYILPLDADDKIGDRYIELALQEFKLNPCLKVVYCKARKFGIINCNWNLKSFSLKNLAKQNMIFCSAFFKKEDWEKVNGFDTNMLYGWEDWEFWIAILKNGGDVKCINKVLFYYRTRNNSMTLQINKEQFEYLKNYLSIKHADFFVVQYGSFFHLVKQNNQFEKSKNLFLKVKSKKFLLNQLCFLLFGFTIFKDPKYKIER